MLTDQNNIECTKVYRSLSAQVFRVRKYFIKLTDMDLVITGFVIAVTMICINFAGLKDTLLFGVFRVDPCAWIGIGLFCILVFSLGHELRPDGNVEKIIHDYFEHKKFACDLVVKDEKWSPSTHRFMDSS